MYLQQIVENVLYHLFSKYQEHIAYEVEWYHISAVKNRTRSDKIKKRRKLCITTTVTNMRL